MFLFSDADLKDAIRVKVFPSFFHVAPAGDFHLLSDKRYTQRDSGRRLSNYPLRWPNYNGEFDYWNRTKIKFKAILNATEWKVILDFKDYDSWMRSEGRVSFEPYLE